MISQDKLVKEINDAKNAVEEYVYDLREKLCGIYQKYINEEVTRRLQIFQITPQQESFKFNRDDYDPKEHSEQSCYVGP